MSGETTPTGVPVIDCEECGRRHPVGRDHCPTCGAATLFHPHCIQGQPS